MAKIRENVVIDISNHNALGYHTPFVFLYNSLIGETVTLYIFQSSGYLKDPFIENICRIPSFIHFGWNFS